MQTKGKYVNCLSTRASVPNSDPARSSPFLFLRLADVHPQMPDRRDNVDLSSRIAPPATPASARPWLGLYFRCAGQYVRAYRNSAGTAYSARCPKCCQTIRFPVGPGGTNDRMFEVDC